MIPEAQWRERIAQRHQERAVKGEALAALSMLTRSDTCAQDMLALVESAARPGLVERMRRHQLRVQAQRAQRKS